MSISENIKKIRGTLTKPSCRLIAVSKTYPAEVIMQAYEEGQKIFGENKVQELLPKFEILPKDIQWHVIGHLQTNKVKYIAPFVHTIHSVDSMKLLKEINKEAEKNKRIINVLLEIYIAEEETKFGLSFQEAEEILKSSDLPNLRNIKINGFMGMASNIEDQSKIRLEFRKLKTFSDQMSSKYSAFNIDLQELSMGMSSDYKIAMEEGSTFVRIGSSIFGSRK
jgi:pyridoxal phosphate enzyme (YggS family)